MDENGRVIVSDKQPKGVKFERIEYDPNANILDSPKRSSERKLAPADSVDARISERIRLRDRLQAQLSAARDRLAAAREALANNHDPKEDEWQPTVTHPDNGGKPNSKGVITGRNGRVVCNRDGSGRVVCPAVPVPSAAYRERLEALQQAVQAAEEAVRIAEVNYRRNAPD